MSRAALDKALWFGFVGAGLLVAVQPGWAGVTDRWVPTVRFGLVLLLLPPVCYFCARKLLPKEFPIRIRIQAFKALGKEVTYDGDSIARLLEQEMEPPTPSKEAQARQRAEPRSQPLSLSLAGTTIPLEFLWKRIDAWALGPVCRIEGIISEDEEGKVSLEAWCSERGDRWRVKSHPHPDSDSLRTALRSLVDEIRASFGHYRELADKFEAQHRYNDAIRYYQRLGSEEQGTSLAHLYLSSGRLEEAERTFEEVRSGSSDQALRDEGTRGLALTHAARGGHSKALELLQGIEGRLKVEARLDCARIHSELGEFEAARNELKELQPVLDKRIHSALEADRSELALDELELRVSRLDGEAFTRFYVDVWSLADLHGSLGRCALELGDTEESRAQFESAVEVMLGQLVFAGPAHQIALDLGVRMEDLGQFDEALGFYDDCLEAAQSEFREEPDDSYLLTNISWALAGKLGCTDKKIKRLLGSVDDPETTRRITNGAVQVASLLQGVPEELREVLFIEAVQGAESFHQSGAPGLPKDPTSPGLGELLATVVAELFAEVGELEFTPFFDLIKLVADREEQGTASRQSFIELMQRPTPRHHAEALFGLACIDTIVGNHETAIMTLRLAIEEAPDLRYRARTDEDLRDLRPLSDFRELVGLASADSESALDSPSRVFQSTESSLPGGG